MYIQYACWIREHQNKRNNRTWQWELPIAMLNQTRLIPYISEQGQTGAVGFKCSHKNDINDDRENPFLKMMSVSTAPSHSNHIIHGCGWFQTLRHPCHSSLLLLITSLFLVVGMVVYDSLIMFVVVEQFGPCWSLLAIVTIISHCLQSLLQPTTIYDAHSNHYQAAHWR